MGGRMSERPGESRDLSVPDKQQRLLGYLHRLRQAPPQVLLLEGGNEAERRDVGLYWAALLNCKSEASPCLSCPTCRQIGEQVFRDVYFFDGADGTVKIGDVRHIRRMMGERPEYGGTRCFVFHEAQELTVSAANSLLKSMEEPLPGNVFVLLVALRDRLLPTLVSRSMVLTLNWSVRSSPAHELSREWEQLLLEFWKTGRGLFARTGLKKELDRNLVRSILSDNQRSLVQAMCGQPQTPAAQFWVEHSDRLSFGRVESLLNKALEILSYQTNPVMVFEWYAVKIWTWIRE
jgi:DNA polymerase-3 subunit delta'